MMKIEDLELECKKRSIELPQTQKRAYRRQLSDILGDHSLRTMPELDTPQMRLRRSLESPMLCFKFKDLKAVEQEECLRGDLWVAEQKYNGVRAIVVWEPKSGLRVFSRHLSDVTFVPVDFTNNILWGSKIQAPHAIYEPLITALLHHHDIPAFVLDCEILTDNNIRMETGDYTGSTLNAAVAILNMLPEKSQRTQIEQNAWLHFRVFDILFLDGKSLQEKPLLLRKHQLSKIVKALQAAMPGGFWRSVPFFSMDKERFLTRLWNVGGEGIVLKRLDQPYIARDSRPRHVQVKLKRSMSQLLQDEVDAFIIGSVPGTPGTSNEGLVGSIKLGVWLEDDEEVVHHIATVSGIPMALRRQMSAPDGSLQPAFLNKVVQFDGMAVSPRSLRYAHAVVNWDTAWRPDKSHMECSITREELERNVI